MSTVTVFIEGLCLWLTGGSGAVPVVIPDYVNAVPAHRAVLTVVNGFDGSCPPPFTRDPDEPEACVFHLNKVGYTGGVKIELVGDAPPVTSNLCLLPRIQHTVPLTLLREYETDGGAKLAAQMLVSQGELTAFLHAGCEDQPAKCPRSVQWNFTTTSGGVTLRLRNLREGGTVSLPLLSGAVLSVSNRRTERPAPGETDLADWCLYFGMFEDAGCPGVPTAPVCITASRRVAALHTRHHTYKFETIACSNSQYP